MLKFSVISWCDGLAQKLPHWMENYPEFDLPAYFGVEAASDVPWGHAVNSHQKLIDALQQDVMLGTRQFFWN